MFPKPPQDQEQATAPNPSGISSDLRELENTKVPHPSDGESSGLIEREEDTANFGGSFNYQPSGASSSSIHGKKLSILAPSLGGLGIIMIIALSSLLPMKLIGIVANIHSKSTAIASTVVEKRVEKAYASIFEKWITNRGAADASQEGALVCNGLTPFCGMRWNKIKDVLDKKYIYEEGYIKEIIPDSNILGKRSRQWKIVVENGEINETSRKEMIKLINYLVDENPKAGSVLSRYISKRGLMKVYGIRRFVPFEATRNSVAEKREMLLNKIEENTTDKVMPRIGGYLSCLRKPMSCGNDLEDIAKHTPDPSIPKSVTDANGVTSAIEVPESAEKTLAEEAGKTIGSIESAIAEETAEKAGKTATKKIGTRIVTSMAVRGGLKAIPIIGWVGLINDGVNAYDSVENGLLEELAYDYRAAVYVQFALAEEGGVVPLVESFKAGQNQDAAIMQVLGNDLFMNIEKSPVFQAENGLLTGSESSFTRTCGDNDNLKEETLPNRYVCPDREVSPRFRVTKALNSGWISKIGAAVDIWRSTIGQIFRAIDWGGGYIARFLGAGFNAIREPLKVIFHSFPPVYITNEIFEALDIDVGDQIDSVQEKTAQQLARLFGWMLDEFFGIPELGAETTGDNNYDALSAGMWVSQNKIMELDEENGVVYGGGGQALNNEQVAAIQQEYDNKQLEYFNSQPILAKMFDTDLQYSFANQILARIPMAAFIQPAGVLSLPSAGLASLSSTVTPSSMAKTGPLNPHNIPLYGYALSDPILDKKIEDEAFSKEKCDEYAKIRKESRKRDSNKDTGYNISFYTTTNPCSLEKLAAGIVLDSLGITDEEYSLKNDSTDSSYDTSQWPTAEAIDKLIEHFEASNGPTKLHGMGNLFIQFGQKYGINPGIIAAILVRESSIGANPADLLPPHNNFGGLTAINGDSSTYGDCGIFYAVDRYWKEFCTPEAGLEANFAIFDLAIYRNTGGAMSDILDVYAPVGDKNDRVDMWNIYHEVAKLLNITIEESTNIYSEKSSSSSEFSTDGKGLASVLGKKELSRPPFDFKQVGEDYYDYGIDMGLGGTGNLHTGADLFGDLEDPLYSPVNGTVICSGTGNGVPGLDGTGCGAFNDYLAKGNGRIQIDTDDGTIVILGHSSTSTVSVGQRVKVGQKVGTMGGMNGPHVHVEIRQRQGDRWILIDPRVYLSNVSS